MSNDIVGIVMPKWGLSMTEGVIVRWLVSEGDTVAPGDEIAEIDTDKIDGDMEATGGGVVRRIVAPQGGRFRVGALLAVVADPAVDEAAVDAFVAGFPEPEEQEAGAGVDSSPYAMLSVGDVQIRYSLIGDGPPVVLIHGFGGDLDNWLFNITSLAEHSSVLAFDLPGHGSSSLVIPDATVSGLAGFAWSVLEALEIDEAIALVGHSMGSAIAAQMAIDRPDRVRSVALIAGAGMGSEINQSYIDAFVSARSKREMKEVAKTLFADPTSVTRSMIDDMLRYKRLDGVPELLADLAGHWFSDGIQQVDLTAGLGVLEVPMMVIWGADDRVIPAAQAAAADGFATVHVIDGAGHMVQMEKANDVNRLLAAHLSEESTAPA